MQPQILLLKDGTESAGGKQQVISNINACQAIVDAVRTTLGPRGMDKLIVDPRVRTNTSSRNIIPDMKDMTENTWVKEKEYFNSFLFTGKSHHQQ